MGTSKNVTITAEDVLLKLKDKGDWATPDTQPENTLTYDQIAAATGLKVPVVAKRMKAAGAAGQRFGKNKLAFTPE